MEASLLHMLLQGQSCQRCVKRVFIGVQLISKTDRENPVRFDDDHYHEVSRVRLMRGNQSLALQAKHWGS